MRIPARSAAARPIGRAYSARVSAVCTTARSRRGLVRMTRDQGGAMAGGTSLDAAQASPVAAKAAAIDAAQGHPLTWKTIIKRALAVAVAGAAVYLVLPGLIAVLGAWPRLSTLNPIWFTVCLAAELASFTCHFALQ